jgi:hypothetical protein
MKRLIAAAVATLAMTLTAIAQVVIDGSDQAYPATDMNPMSFPAPCIKKKTAPEGAGPLHRHYWRKRYAAASRSFCISPSLS